MARLTDKQADRVFDSILLKLEGQLKRKLNANFNQLSKDIQRALEAYDEAGAAAIVSLNDIVIEKMLIETYEAGIIQGARMTERDVFGDNEDGFAEETLLLLLLWLRSTAKTVAMEINTTTFKILTKVMDDQRALGLSGPELSKAVSKEMKQRNLNRSTTISTTEAQRGIQEGSQEMGNKIDDLFSSGGGMGRLGRGRLPVDNQPVTIPTPVLEKQWRSQGDRRVRKTHQRANGQRVGPKDLFVVGKGKGRFPLDVMLPKDETINCRCYLRWRARLA